MTSILKNDDLQSFQNSRQLRNFPIAELALKKKALGDFGAVVCYNNSSAESSAELIPSSPL